MTRTQWTLLVFMLTIPAWLNGGCSSATTTHREGLPALLDGTGVDTTEEVGSAYWETLMTDADIPVIEGRTVYTADVTLSGTENDQHVHGRFWVGADYGSGSLRLESIRTAPVQFRFFASHAYKGQNDPSDVDGVLLLHTGSLVVQHVGSRDLLDTILGIPLSAAEFLGVLWGQTSFITGGTLIGQRFGPKWMRVSFGDVVPPGELVLKRETASAKWRLFAMSRREPGRNLRWQALFQPRVRGVYRNIQVRSLEWNGEAGRAFDVHLSLNRTRVGASLGPEAFSPDFPSTIDDISLKELKQRQRRFVPLVSNEARLR